MNPPSNETDVAVIGAGAAGLVAAISARRRSRSVLLLEKTAAPGKKLLAAGAGRCNLLNENFEASRLNAESKALAESVLKQFGKAQILDFFKELGLAYYADGERIFPVTNQSASVLSVLELELNRLGASPLCHSAVTEVTPAAKRGFILKSAGGKTFFARKVVLTGGGKSYPAFGSDGSAYELAKRLGHSIVEPVPIAVPLTAKDPWCHHLQGQRIRAGVTAVIRGKNSGRADGEVLFTQYGLSGTAILDASESLSIAYHRHGIRDISITADLVPFLSREELCRELESRLERGIPREKILTGLLPEKFVRLPGKQIPETSPEALSRNLKEKSFGITGTRGWNEAEFTAGGVDLGEVCHTTLESSRVSGLFFAGEILNVHGPRGGFNLGWAWSSGFVAGHHAAIS